MEPKCLQENLAISDEAVRKGPAGLHKDGDEGVHHQGSDLFDTKLHILAPAFLSSCKIKTEGISKFDDCKGRSGIE